MSVYIEGIGTHKINYRDHNEVEFSNLSEYMLMAKKSISKFANKFYNGLSRIMLQDEDAVSSVAYCIMLADWRYDENYNTKIKNKTRYSYRNQCAIWAIQSYVTKNYRKQKSKQYHTYSLDYPTDQEKSNTYYTYIEDPKTKSPVQVLQEQERLETIKTKVRDLINDETISEQQREYIRLYYYEGMTFDQIGKRFSLTREAIRQSIKKAIKAIRENNNTENEYEYL